MIRIREFFKNWPKSQQLLLLFLFIFLACQVLLLLFWNFRGIENVLAWDVATELHKKYTSKVAFVAKGLQFSNNELVYYVKEWFIPSTQQIQIYPAYFLLFSTVLGLSFAAVSLSYQKSVWFFVSILSVAAFLLASRLEIAYQQLSNLPFLLAFFSVGGLLFVFNSFAKKLDFGLRISAILLLFAIILGYAALAQKVEFPLFAMVEYGLIFPISIFVIFVFLIAHEGIAVIVWASSTSSIKGKSSLGSFLILASIYLANCLLIYLENLRVIDQSFFVISPVWLYLFSLTLGFWGFKKQSEDLEWFSFRQTGLWLYLGLALISTALLGYAFAIADDPLTELLEDYIAICHLAVGTVFFLHILINFIQLFREGQRVERVMYKPKFTRLLLAKIAAIFLVGFLLIQKNIYSYNQLNAALNNAKGDFYTQIGDQTAAETFYKASAELDYYNHKANYALGKMAQDVGDGSTAAYFYKRAIQKNPSEFAFVALSQNLEAEDLYFDALFNLREGLAKFPESEYLATNTARILEKANARDSVFLYLNRAFEMCPKCAVTNTNMLAFWIENAKVEKLDSAKNQFLQRDNYGNLANQIAISRMNEVPLDFEPKMYQQNMPSTAEFAALYNQVLLTENKENYPDSLWAGLIENTVSSGLNQDVLFLKARQAYKNEDKISAIKQLTYLTKDSTENGLMYRRNLAMWYLQEGLYDKSIQYLTLSGDVNSVELLEQQHFKELLLNTQKQQAEELKQFELTQENSQEMSRKAPFNPFWINYIADFLVSKNEVNAAYTMVLNALEFNENSESLWKKYVRLAYKNGVSSYAENGLNKLQSLLPAAEFASFSKEAERLKQELKMKQETF